MTLSSRSAVLSLFVAIVACGGRLSGAGTGGSSGSSASGAGSGGSSGSSASGGADNDGSAGSAPADATSCSSFGCGPAPACAEGCRSPCGCCPCIPGDVRNVEGVEYVCEGDCFKPRGDGGGTCSTDLDCPYGFFCSALEDGGRGCAPYVGEGESCKGFTQRCAPDLICNDEGPVSIDTPGTCRVSCVLQTECPTDRYCSESDKVCRNDGTCFDDSECNQVGNDYPRPTCIGIGLCTDGTCTYRCGR